MLETHENEVVKVEYEYIEADGAGPVIETYVTRDCSIARRYWAVHRWLLVGGNIAGTEDAMHLARDYGVTHVLSFESEFTDDGMWSQRNRAQAPFEDNGRPPPLDLLCRAVQWVKDLPREGVVLYAHARLGGSRGPTAAYLILRARWGMSHDMAQKYAGRRQDGSALFPCYLSQVDKAILKVTGRERDR